MTNYQIDCINKPDRDNRHERITHAGGPQADGSRWKAPVADIIRWIEAKEHSFYTQEGGRTAWVGVRTSATGHKFIQTHADGQWSDNLLALQECA